jgi:hypothetical protein
MEEGWKTLTKVVYLLEHHVQVFIILNINCTYVYMFLNKKSCQVGPALWTEATAQAPHDARVGLARALLNRSCLGPARQTRLISPATNMYVHLFSSPPALRDLISGGDEGWKSLICCLWYPCVHKNITRRAKTMNKNS